jgi:hypothetical protein
MNDQRNAAEDDDAEDYQASIKPMPTDPGMSNPSAVFPP